MSDPTTPPSLSLGDLVTLALDTAKAVEAVYPAGTPGAEKLATVMTLVKQFAPLATVAASIVETVVPAIISIAVAQWHKFGLFVHSVEAQATTAP